MQFIHIAAGLGDTIGMDDRPVDDDIAIRIAGREAHAKGGGPEFEIAMQPLAEGLVDIAAAIGRADFANRRAHALMTLQPGHTIVIAGGGSGRATHAGLAYVDRSVRHAGRAVQEWLVTLNEPTALLSGLTAFLADGVTGIGNVGIRVTIGTMANRVVTPFASASTETRQQEQ